MWGIMNQGPATTILDYTNDLSMLLIGLIGVVWLSAVICVWMAIQHYYSSRMQHPIVDMPVDTPSLTTDQQDAA